MIENFVETVRKVEEVPRHLSIYRKYRNIFILILDASFQVHCFLQFFQPISFLLRSHAEVTFMRCSILSLVKYRRIRSEQASGKLHSAINCNTALAGFNKWLLAKPFLYCRVRKSLNKGNLLAHLSSLNISINF